MAKPNYAFQKRQRDLAKKQKKEEKKQRKAVPLDGQPQEAPAEPPVEDLGAPPAVKELVPVAHDIGVWAVCTAPPG